MQTVCSMKSAIFQRVDAGHGTFYMLVYSITGLLLDLMEHFCQYFICLVRPFIQHYRLVT